MKRGLPPFEILRLALETPGVIITREDLKNSNREAVYIGKKSIATQVYDRNSVVRNELLPFVRLTNDSICANSQVNLTILQIRNLTKVCF